MNPGPSPCYGCSSTELHTYLAFGFWWELGLSLSGASRTRTQDSLTLASRVLGLQASVALFCLSLPRGMLHTVLPQLTFCSYEVGNSCVHRTTSFPSSGNLQSKAASPLRRCCFYPWVKNLQMLPTGSSTADCAFRPTNAGSLVQE